MEDSKDLLKMLFGALDAAKDPPYYNRPIPCDFDRRIGNLIHTFIDASPEWRELLLASVAKNWSGWFFAFSDRMAALGVREKSYDRLLDGLLALLIEGGKFDLRENIVSLGLHYHSATIIGVNPARLFEVAASYGENVVADQMLEFLTRKPEERSLRAMGFVEGVDDDGFRYEQAYKLRNR